jgi:DNA-binding HxlR family transcriptional regulator
VKTGRPTTKVLRGSIGNLIGLGALERRRLDGERDLLDNELTPFGRELLFVAEVLDAWLSASPVGPLQLESAAAKEAVRALVSGWGSTMLRALAARPLSPSELDDLIASFSQSAIERRLFAMRSAGQVAAVSPSDSSTAYAVTEWLRKGVAPLLAAIRCEQLHLSIETAPVTRIDVETLLLLTVPQVGSLGGVSGACQVAVDIAGQGPAGVRVSIEGGSIVSCVSKLESSPPGWVGSSATWLDAVIEGPPQSLGEDDPDGLSRLVLQGLHGLLFPARQGAP